ncbi:MAG TPA: dephospho-CoA kinase [Rhodobacteraceae bacterium]|nr:dephospho-CoA kinase [Paracoccaceae bacterium]
MSRPTVIGLTGSIGMGKSTTAAMFAEAGVAVWDADAAVHRLYAPGGLAVEPIRALRPEAVRNGAVDRHALKAWIKTDPGALARIEAIVHPLVAADRAAFIQYTKADIIVLDIPLLFEIGAVNEVDIVVVVTAPKEMQRERVLERDRMDIATFETILSKQMPDADKRARADFVIETVEIDAARAQVHRVIDAVREGLADA